LRNLRRTTSIARNRSLLGKLIYFDKTLSVNRNEACVFCHMPEVAFTGGVSALNATTGSYPGSVGRGLVTESR
jgi:cytochrome c peroxidase